MVKLCLMASYGYPLGFAMNPELGSCRVSKVRESVHSYVCDLKLLRFCNLVYGEFSLVEAHGFMGWSLGGESFNSGFVPFEFHDLGC